MISLVPNSNSIAKEVLAKQLLPLNNEDEPSLQWQLDECPSRGPESVDQEILARNLNHNHYCTREPWRRTLSVGGSPTFKSALL